MLITRNLAFILLAMTHTFSYGQVDCSMLDPRAGVSKEKEGKIQGSVDTLYKIAKVGASIEGKLKEEIRNLQLGTTAISERYAIAARTIYLFCGMVANAKDISTERKFQLFQLLQEGLKTEIPKNLPKAGAARLDPARPQVRTTATNKSIPISTKSPEFSAALVGEKYTEHELTIIVAAPGSKGGSMRSALVVVPFRSKGQDLKFVTMFFPKDPVLITPGMRQQFDLPWMETSSHIQGKAIEARHPTADEVELLRPLVKDWTKKDCEFAVDLVSETGSEPMPQHVFGCSALRGTLSLALESALQAGLAQSRK